MEFNQPRMEIKPRKKVQIIQTTKNNANHHMAPIEDWTAKSAPGRGTAGKRFVPSRLRLSLAEYLGIQNPIPPWFQIFPAGV